MSALQSEASALLNPLAPTLQLLRAAIAQHPTSAWARRRYIDGLAASSQWNEALTHGLVLCQLAPSSESKQVLTNILVRLHRFSEAADLLNECESPETEVSFIEHAHVFERAAFVQRARGCYETAILRWPYSELLFERFSHFLIRAREFNEALALIEGHEIKHPGCTRARSQRVRILRAQGHTAEADRLNGLDAFLRVYEDAAIACGELGQALARDPSRASDNPRRMTRGGWRIDGIDFAREPIYEVLRASIQQHLLRYIAECAHDDHEFVRAMPRRVSLSAWCIGLHEDAYQAWHMHPAGWVSGVFYVSVPEDLPGTRGALVFGPPEGEAFGQPAGGLCQWHKPRAGELVLFPSHVYHYVVPTRTQQERISVAFDVIPRPDDSTEGFLLC